ncbi:Nucleosomal histone H3-Lys79 methylase [Myotisia sp. PD_48]|nr:Nucleosomal histone H3-Lys79 methylase [Myotisia sp. PD_48]
MGFFDHLQKKGTGAIQAQGFQIRKVESKSPLARSSSAPSRAGTSSPLSQSSLKRVTTSPQTLHKKKKSINTEENNRLIPVPSRPKSSLRKRASPIQRLCSSSDDDSESDGETLDIRLGKRRKVSASAEPTVKRRIRSEASFSKAADRPLPVVQAADITTAEKSSSEFRNAFKGTEGRVSIMLQYPSFSPREKYQLVVPRENDGFKPLDDVLQVVQMVSQHYIPDEKRSIFDDESTGLIRRLRRALTKGSMLDFKNAVRDYNATVEGLLTEGKIAKHLDEMDSLPLSLIERILTQVYARMVSPRVESLRQYENGTDNVYGELLPRFISEIFKRTNLAPDQVFVDLGSGVGNVVLQAALEIGCESWGCEMMKNACALAELQQAEFKARCRLWGLSAGKVHLVEGDFLEDERIGKALRKADVVLINNQAFTPETNNRLINHLLDFKEGCKIVSLKSFVPSGHKLQARNLNSPINLLSVKKHDYWSDCVSWTNAGGSYFIATKDSSRLREFTDTHFKSASR